MKEFVIDLFAGAGGTSTGAHLSNDRIEIKNWNSFKIENLETVVIACVNHDEIALESHKRNHPYTRHYREDIRNPTIIARQDKNPLGLITCEVNPEFRVPIYEDDSEIMIKIKVFMAYYQISDIRMRMLFVQELKEIQGFPKDYILLGNQTQQKKFIGNSVEVTLAKAFFKAHKNAIREKLLFAA